MKLESAARALIVPRVAVSQFRIGAERIIHSSRKYLIDRECGQGIDGGGGERGKL